jgi:2-polyprenyl-6-hydroxyphenyl methylase/3-demethylubiquinone-9 3-methyltransferase
MVKYISVWGYSIPVNTISKEEIEYLTNLPQFLPKIEWLWAEMDRIWDKFSLCNKRSLVGQPVAKFYRHPVWLINGIFSAVDSTSVAHRKAIALYLYNSSMKEIADFGGGFGSLAQVITNTIKASNVEIIEPYQSQFSIDLFKKSNRIKLVSELDCKRYDAVIAQDVLEHVEDPINLASQIASAARLNGKIIFANCFYPVIKCHLPSTFHFRHTFFLVMMALGLKYIGRVSGAEHALVFERKSQICLSRARKAEKISSLIGPAFNMLFEILTRFRRNLK